MNEHLANLVKTELLDQGVTPTEVTKWQEKLASTPDPDEWEKVLVELKSIYGKELDQAKRIESYIRTSKLSILRNVDTTETELPEEIVEAVGEALKKGKNHILMKSEGKMSYPELVRCLDILCISSLNIHAFPEKPSTYKLPFMISSSDTIQGAITSQASSGKRDITLLSLYVKDDESYYHFFGKRLNRQFLSRAKLVASNICPFYIYKFRIDGIQDAFVFSMEELEIGPCKIIGMRVETNDFIKVGELAKIPSSTPCFFAHHQEPEIRRISQEEFREQVKGWTFDSLAAKLFSIYRQPPWFEKFIMAWLVSGKFSGYPLHFAILSPPGIGKTFMMEGLANLTSESVASGSQDTIKGLVPSFGNGIAKEGYLAMCKRYAYLDEFFAMVRKTAVNYGGPEADSGTYMMLEMLEHKEREARSGNGSIKVKPRMKCLMASNSKSYNKMKNLVEVSKNLNPAFVSRWLWYVVLPQHEHFIQEQKRKLAPYDRSEHTPQYDPKFIEVLDYLQSFILKIDTDKVWETLKKFRSDLPNDIVETIYDPRADHHLLCMLDGYAKINSIIENRPEICVTDSDYEEVEKVFGDIVFSWNQDVDLKSMPEARRIDYLPKKLRDAYDYIVDNPGLPTPDLNMYLGTNARRILDKLRDIGVLKTVTDADGVTLLWYPYTYR